MTFFCFMLWARLVLCSSCEHNWFLSLWQIHVNISNCVHEVVYGPFVHISVLGNLVVYLRAITIKMAYMHLWTNPHRVSTTLHHRLVYLSGVRYVNLANVCVCTQLLWISCANICISLPFYVLHQHQQWNSLFYYTNYVVPVILVFLESLCVLIWHYWQNVHFPLLFYQLWNSYGFNATLQWFEVYLVVHHNKIGIN